MHRGLNSWLNYVSFEFTLFIRVRYVPEIFGELGRGHFAFVHTIDLVRFGGCMEGAPFDLVERDAITVSRGVKNAKIGCIAQIIGELKSVPFVVYTDDFALLQFVFEDVVKPRLGFSHLTGNASITGGFHFSRSPFRPESIGVGNKV